MYRVGVIGVPVAMLLIPSVVQSAKGYQSKHHRPVGYHSERHSSRHARHDRRHSARNRLRNCTLTKNGRQICSPHYRAAHTASLDANGTIIGGRPAGCPHAYCGCGLRKYLGLSDKRLNLAANWARFFPHVASPRPGLVAVRRHHVMYIEAAAEKERWLIRDYNSGGGLSRLHVCDIRGYVFVDPRARVAKR